MLSKIGLIYVPFQDAYTCIICMTNLLICALLRRIFVSIFFFYKKKIFPKKTQRNFKNNLRLAALNFCRWCIFIFNQKKEIQQKNEFLRKLKISKTIIESTLLYWIELDCTFLPLKMNTRFFLMPLSQCFANELIFFFLY